MERARILIIHTGGTLGMVPGHPGPFTVGGDPLAGLLRKVPELSEIADIQLELLANQDSCDVKAAQWEAWARRIRDADAVDGVVIIHGTDTMAFTAGVLAFLLEERRLPIVLTGSQRPLGMIRTDARNNLIDALILARSGRNEVMVCFDSRGWRGTRVLKRSSEAMDAFYSPNTPPLVHLGVDLRWGDHVLTTPGVARRLRVGSNVQLSWVLPDLPAPAPWEPDGPAVRVIAAFGGGTLPVHAGWADLVREEMKNGVVHLLVSQCPHGKLFLDRYESSHKLLDLGVIDGGDMSDVAAVAKARVGLGQGFDESALRAYLAASVAGERTLKEEGE